VDKLAQKLKSFGGKIRLLERQAGEAPEVPPSATVRDRTRTSATRAGKFF
jgi:hypothetical protein